MSDERMRGTDSDVREATSLWANDHMAQRIRQLTAERDNWRQLATTAHAEREAMRKRAEAAEAALAAVPWDALRWIDEYHRAYKWNSTEGPPAYAALHDWLQFRA